MEIFYLISITTLIILFIMFIIINYKIKRIKKQKENYSNHSKKSDNINHSITKNNNMDTNSFSNNLYEIAKSLIIACNIGNKQIAQNNMVTLYRATEGYKSKLLLQINPK